MSPGNGKAPGGAMYHPPAPTSKRMQINIFLSALSEVLSLEEILPSPLLSIVIPSKLCFARNLKSKVRRLLIMSIKNI